MDLKHAAGPTMSEESIERVRRHIGLLVKVYYQIGDKHLNSENEADLEDFARLLLAFSAAIGSHLKGIAENPAMDRDATLEELHFYEMGLKQLNRT